MSTLARLRSVLLRALFGKVPDAASLSTWRSWRPAQLDDPRLTLSRSTRKVLQARSRDWDLDSPLYSKIADLWEQYTVGTGIQLLASSTAADWNPLADEVFSRWKAVADLQSRFGFDNLQGVMARKLFLDGEIFVVLTREGQFPRIQLIESHRCETPEGLQQEEGRSIVDGVEISANGRPLRYWFSGPADEKGRRSFAPRTADEVVHIFEPARPEQYRGIPYATAALNVLWDLHDLHCLEIKAAKDAAELSTIAYSQTGEMPPGLASMQSKFLTTTQPLNSGATGNAETKRSYYQSATGGRVVVAMNTDKIEQHVPERPGSDTREYWKLLSAEVCAVAGVPLALVYPDSMQGTVYRGALDSAASFFRAKTAVLATYFKRIRNFVIEAEARFNRTLLPLPDDWRKVNAGFVRSPNVDIGRNSAAMIAEIAAGMRTWSTAAAELGLDGKALLTQKADELAFIRQLAQDRGLPPELIAAASLPAPEKIFDLAQREPDADPLPA